MPFIIPIQPATLPPSSARPALPAVPASYPKLPTLAAPFTFAGGRADVNEQDSLEDVSSCVLNIVSCTQGDRPDQRDFGVPELLFETFPLDLRALEAAIARSEPRAELSAVQTLTAPDTVAIAQAVGVKDHA